MMASPTVVVLVATGGDPGHLLSSQLGDLSLAESLAGVLGASPIVFALARTMPSAPIAGVTSIVHISNAEAFLPDGMLRLVGASALKRALARFPAGRLANQVGPLDDSRVFWRAVRRNPEAMSVLRSADVVIAADPPAVKTAWMAHHRLGVARAFYGVRAAISELAKRGGRPTA